MLLKILFLVIFIQVICGKEEATLGEFPWTVSLRLSGFVGHDCGGAILNSVKTLKSFLVFCFQSCSDQLWEKNVLGIECFLKFEPEGREFAKIWRSLEQFIWTLKR